ncbi:DNA topoisomerase type I [NY_014 poxvirus]|uniref:DNA topoisomerase type I n=1 Tax=NY_014 poxvirus TaxID=2025360 RepID=UPI000B9A1659|nr:DNA topoisomerase type I [NY_014 poxvirus]AST09497.1 DNA topoisomerase type I [NY_014 poxvirus]
MRELFYKEGKLFFDSKFLNPVPDNNPAYDVLQHIKIPAHLTDVIIYEQTWEDALTRLIFVGRDSKGRKQYFYGKLHVQNRNAKRDRIFIRVYNVMKNINVFIDKYIKKTNDDVKYQLAVFMLMETMFFIRFGKMKYLKENETVGLLTLKNKHIEVNTDKINIKFVGKDKVSHEFVVHKSNRLFKPLMRLTNESMPEEFLFNSLTERKVYNCIKQFGIRIKDLRTYGVNYTFLYNFWTNVKSISPLPSTKKLIVLTIKQTAEVVGHTPSISKSAYMATTILEMVKDKDFLDNMINNTTFDDFIFSVVEHIKSHT